MDSKQSEPIRVLIVDDEVDIREGAKRIIARMGCRVTTAEDGEKALEILEREHFSFMLLDLKMPGIDGMEVLRRVRIMNESILVIIITGFATVETAIEAMKQGAYDFIPKPFEPDHLRIIVGRATEKIRLRDEAEKMAREREKTLSNLHTEKSRVRTIVESLPNGVLVTDFRGNVSLMNLAFIQHFGLNRELAFGEAIGTYIPDEGFCDFVQAISRGENVDADTVPSHEIALPNGKYLLARGRPVLGENGEYLGAVVNVADITALKDLDRVKSEFVAKVSHELRSPLSTIHEQLAMVINDMVDETSKEDQYILSRAKEKTQGLISLIGDLLDLSRIEAGLSFQEIKRIDMGELLSSIVDFMKARAQSRSQILDLKVADPAPPPLMADPVALESIFGNLIANAINYTQEGGTIHVETETADNSLLVRVQDNGFGIDPKYHEKIFDRFYRVKNDKTRFITGTGLGLPIVKSLLEDLGGRIHLESGAGKGSCFSVFIPLHPAEDVSS